MKITFLLTWAHERWNSDLALGYKLSEATFETPLELIRAVKYAKFRSIISRLRNSDFTHEKAVYSLENNLPHAVIGNLYLFHVNCHSPIVI